MASSKATCITESFYHIYNDIWNATVGEQLQCARESGNSADHYAVAIMKDSEVVGH